MCANGVVGTEGWFYDTHSLRTAELPDTPSLRRRGVPLAAHITPMHLNDDVLGSEDEGLLYLRSGTLHTVQSNDW